MKISKVALYIEDFNLSRPYEVTYVRHEYVQNYVLILETDDHVGIGTGCPSVHVTGEQLSKNPALLEDQIRDILIGKDVRTFYNLITDAASLFNDSPALLATIDIALHDLFSKSIGVHISGYLGTRIKPLPTSITIGIKSLQETLEEGKEYVDRGFKKIKLKIGTNYELDIERYLKLRESCPNHVDIRVDANQGFTTQQLLAYIDATAISPVEFFEQPLPQGDYAQMKNLAEDVRRNCAGDEDCQTLNDALHLIADPKPYGIFNIKLMKCGGLLEARRISDVAIRTNIDLMWGCMDESCISIAAALNMAYACPNTKYIDLDGSFDLSKDIASGGFILKDGVMYPDMNHLGISAELN